MFLAKLFESHLTDSPKLQKKNIFNIPLLPVDPADTVNTDHYGALRQLADKAYTFFAFFGYSSKPDLTCCKQMSSGIRGLKMTGADIAMTFLQEFHFQNKIRSFSSSNSCKKYWSKCKHCQTYIFLAGKYLHKKNYVRNNTTGRGLTWQNKISIIETHVFLYLALLCYRTYGI